MQVESLLILRYFTDKFCQTHHARAMYSYLYAMKHELYIYILHFYSYIFFNLHSMKLITNNIIKLKIYFVNTPYNYASNKKNKKPTQDKT
ncbi:hypothetical protein rsdtw13_34790 [Clostridium sp. TW13]|uniref:Uncharacterized protein n=1 Tax=Inconstantimicrobium mannanitabidum TaxID=1604901 RepID=A0ACB5RGJ6_9CLOT|nr:hypothetical protein rsdtw13_34790 [Clostridium sp. TW13]